MNTNILIDIINSDITKATQLDKDGLLEIDEQGFEFFHIQEVTFEDDSPRREVLENVISSLQINDINFVYLLVGSKDKISFYLGVAKNQKELKIDIDDVANQILKSSIEGNFRGSKIQKLKKHQKKEIQTEIKKFKYIAEIDGVPNVNEDAKKFQGVDRLVDIMSGDTFMLMIIANSLGLDILKTMEKELFSIYDKLTPFVKKTIQKSKNISKQKSDTTSNTDSTSENSSNSQASSNSTNKTNSPSTTKSTVESDNDTSSKSDSKSHSTSHLTSLSYSDQTSENETTNIEFEKKELEEWLKYIDEVLLKRISYAKGKGGFRSGVYLFADTKGKITKLANNFISLFSGVEQNKVPLTYEYIQNTLYKEYLYNFQLPLYKVYGNKNQLQKMLLYSKYNKIDWFSTKELSVIASLPQKEVIGLRLKEEVEFGLNIDKIEDKKINLGKIVKSGNETNIDVDLSLKELNKHLFITGVTGSGKTTTCQKILYESKLPFLVVEPAKTEYRDLMQIDDILVFTFGDENIAPFRLNPFEFFEGENISSRVDMIKAAIESAFVMEAAIPQIIESAIYSSYQNYGWDIATNKNYKFENPFHKNIHSFPTLEDVINEVSVVVEQQGFDDRLKNDYIGSIKARLQGLVVGSKGFMLNTPRSFDFKELIDKKVIIELEEVKNPSEKSFIMGLILINLNEAIKIKYKENKNFKHITLIEEAHRLLSKYEAGDSLNKKTGVETFTDMLAEIRKYGESLIIVDQIANKLTSEVLKNTNTKIVHRIFAIDDKEAIGNTMALEENQKNFLSKLDVGKVIVFNQNYYNAIQVKITPLHLDMQKSVDIMQIREKWLQFYKSFIDIDLDLESLSRVLNFSKSWEIFVKYEQENEVTFVIYKKNIHKMLLEIDLNLNILSDFLNRTYYQNSNDNLLEVLEELKKSDTIGLLIKKIRKI